MKKNGIVGGGFSGTMAAVQLINQSTVPCEILLINEKETLNKGIAYNPYSNKHLLNVMAAKMGAYPDKPNDFLDWLMRFPAFKEKDQNLIANSFMPRRLYGTYLEEIWQHGLQMAKSKGIEVTVISSEVKDLTIQEQRIFLKLDNHTTLEVDDCVITTGNHLPRNPGIKNELFFQSKNYFQNPWSLESVTDTKKDMPVLIIGNGLTMVDTVLGLLEQGFVGVIFSISPNGFNILPHRENGLKYTKLTDELKPGLSLLELVKLVNKHVKAVRAYGISAEPVIDSLRPYTQQIWKSLSDKEKSLFMSRLRHLWGVARHRIPLHTHDKIQQIRIAGKLQIKAGRIKAIDETEKNIRVTYFDKKEGTEQTLEVSRIINCTGPETDLMNLNHSFLKKCLLEGIVAQDKLKLGIVANTDTFQVINAAGKPHAHLFTIGSSLKGELWESTAVNELRDQAARLAKGLLKT